MTLARRMGLRAFDGALVIAIVQDAARSGAQVPGSPGMAPEFVSRLALIRPADSSDAPASAISLALAVLLASGLFLAAMYWLGA